MTRLPQTQSPFSWPAESGDRGAPAALSAPVPRATSDWRERLTPREREILERLARGLRYAEIAAELGVRAPTVKNHLHRIYEKIEVRSRTEAAVKWLSR